MKMTDKNRLEVKICNKVFKNPIIAASGTFNFGREFNEIFDISRLGGISTKGLTLLPRQGNPSPRIAETASGMLNSVGLQNPGGEEFVKKELPFLRQHNTVIIVNVAGNTEEDYMALAEKVSSADIDIIELNISCPNVKEGGIAFGTSCLNVRRITEQVKLSIKNNIPLMVKLSPNVSDIKSIAKSAEDGGADCISLINTLTGMAVDINTKKPLLANVTGGLSGPCIKPIALKMVYDVYKTVKIPVIGMGGITTYSDVVEFMLCGASAVQVGTAGISNPMAFVEIIDNLKEYVYKNNLKNISELTGGLKI